MDFKIVTTWDCKLAKQTVKNIILEHMNCNAIVWEKQETTIIRVKHRKNKKINFSTEIQKTYKMNSKFPVKNYINQREKS